MISICINSNERKRQTLGYLCQHSYGCEFWYIKQKSQETYGLDLMLRSGQSRGPEKKKKKKKQHSTTNNTAQHTRIVSCGTTGLEAMNVSGLHSHHSLKHLPLPEEQNKNYLWC